MNLSIVIISYKSLEKLENCLSGLGKNIEKIIVENSNNFQFKELIEKKYYKAKVIINNENLGFGKAANIGFQKINTKYALLLSTDVKIDESQLIKIQNEIDNCNEEFALATPLHDDLIDFNNSNNFDKHFKSKKINISTNESKTKIDLIKGCSLIVNFNKFKDKYIFDENFFFFFEEIDLCKRIKNINENIFVFNKIKIFHEGGKGVDPKIAQNYSDFRHWNYYWSRFYYHKKHYGFLYSLFIHLSKLIRFFISFLALYFFSKEKFRKNKFRFFGLFSSVIGIKSSVSKDILNKN